jgi:hypothetical protein
MTTGASSPVTIPTANAFTKTIVFAARSVLSRRLNGVDHQHIHRPPSRFQLETELFLKSREQRRRLFDLSAWRKPRARRIVPPPASDASDLLAGRFCALPM